MDRGNKILCRTLGKPGQQQVNEDSVRAGGNLMAVSDGAGGGGIYADRWSAYLVGHLPDEPITSFSGLNAWVDGIWEEFFNLYEQEAMKRGSLTLQKFYDEGSFATLAAAWISGNKCRWIAYGDSVVFHYCQSSRRLQHSFTSLVDFNKPPYLISLHHPLLEAGFRAGEYELCRGDVVMCASDALSHYILMEYALLHPEEYGEQLSAAAAASTKNSVIIAIARSVKSSFYNDVVLKLLNCGCSGVNFSRHVERLLRRGLLSLDDYSYTLYRYKP